MQITITVWYRDGTGPVQYPITMCCIAYTTNEWIHHNFLRRGLKNARTFTKKLSSFNLNFAEQRKLYRVVHLEGCKK